MAIENVSGTAFVVAEFRAEENAETAPLYRDPVVELFLSEETRQAAGRVAARFPQVREMVKVRTKYFDDTLEKQLVSDVRQVVILGAGLDTRAVRKHSPVVTYFEIDDAATLRIKETCYQAQGFDVNVRFIPGNYVTDGLIDLLARNSFDFELPTYFIWEGNTMYLPLESNKRILTDIRNHVKRFRLSCDYMSESVITRTTGDPGIVTLVDAFANMGAPWLSGIGDIRTLAHELGLSVIENFRTGELYQSVLARPSDDIPDFRVLLRVHTRGSCPSADLVTVGPQSTATPGFSSVAWRWSSGFARATPTTQAHGCSTRVAGLHSPCVYKSPSTWAEHRLVLDQEERDQRARTDTGDDAGRTSSDPAGIQATTRMARRRHRLSGKDVPRDAKATRFIFRSPEPAVGG